MRVAPEGPAGGSVDTRLRSNALVAVVSLVCVGIALRIASLLSGTSISSDEAMLALNVANRPLHELFDPLDNNQSAPLLLLVAEKAVISTVGTVDLAVRLVPFVAGISAVVLFAVLAWRMLTPVGAVMASALIVFSDTLIAWTSSNKQYSVDVLATVLIVLATVVLGERLLRPLHVVAFAATGAVTVWFSYPSAFVLAAAGTAMFGRKWRNGDRAGAVAVAACAGTWLASFAVAYALASQGITRLQKSLDGIESVYPPLSTRSVPTEAIQVALGIVRYVTGMPSFLEWGGRDGGEVVVALLVTFALVGLIALGRRRLDFAVLLAGPIALVLAAGVLERYPLLPRATMFLLPLVALLVGGGTSAATSYGRSSAVRWASGFATALMLLAIGAPALAHVADPMKTQEMKPALQSLAARIRPGDTVFVHYTAQYGLRWYLTCGCAGDEIGRLHASGLLPYRPAVGGPGQWTPTLRSVPPTLVIGPFRGVGDGDAYERDLRRLAGRGRVWVVISDVFEQDRAKMLRTLDKLGKRIYATAGTEGAKTGVYLYDLTR